MVAAGYIVQRTGGTRGAYGTDPNWADTGPVFAGRLSPITTNQITTGMLSDATRNFTFTCPAGTDIRTNDRIRQISDSQIYYVKSVKGILQHQPITLVCIVSENL